MAAFLIANVLEIIDGDKLKEYGAANAPILAKHGGEVIAAGAGEVIEGDISSVRLVVIKFPDMEALKAWYNSDEYKPLIEMRQAAAKGLILAVDGV